MHIADYVASEAQKPFRWGETDCISTADRWVNICTGISPLARSGFGYSNSKQAASILTCRGLLPILVNRAMRLSGFEKTDAPLTGDVGLIIHKQKMCMAIHTGQFWFSHDETGLIGAPLEAIWKAWRIECQ